jgi:hypothetical protein
VLLSELNVNQNQVLLLKSENTFNSMLKQQKDGQVSKILLFRLLTNRSTSYNTSSFRFANISPVSAGNNNL